MKLKLNKITAFFTILLIVISASIPALAASNKKDPCLKSNNGIGNNHDIDIELPTNSLSLDDLSNQILSIRIDPGNQGQTNKFKTELGQQGFNTTEINFVVAQLWDAEMKVQQNNLQCSTIVGYSLDKDYTLLAD